jgi:molybdopterin molybdotransferase
MISFDAAEKIHRRALERGAVCPKTLCESLGCVCAEDVFACEDSPSFDKAMMDGFAVRFRELRGFRKAMAVSMSVFAAQAPGSLRPGTCCKIATGAALPSGADTVVKKEDASERKGGLEVILKKAARGTDVLPRGAHFRKGEKIFLKGDKVSLAGIGLAASQGIKDLLVYAAPVVALLSTGDELAADAGPRKRFDIRNATGPMLVSALKETGARILELGACEDDHKKLLALIRQGLEADIFIVTGAVSAGERDMVPRLLKEAGVKVIFHRVRMKPGKPVLFGRRGRTLVYGLPGNPVSTLVAFSVFAKPAIEYWRGGSGGILFEAGVMKVRFAYASDRLSFLPARLYDKEGHWQVDPLAWRDSADLCPVARADGFFVYESGVKSLARGASVRFLRTARHP